MGTTILLSALALVLVAMATASALVGLAAWTAVRRNRVHPTVETGAPLFWSWWPGPCARAHRRLRGAVHDISLPHRRRARRPGRVPPTHNIESGTLGPALVAQAVAVDRQLVMAAHLPAAARRAVLRGLRNDVARIDRLGRAYRREGLAAQESPLPACGVERSAVLDAIELRLRHLHEAHAELRAVEAETAPDHLARAVPAYPVATPSRRAPGHAA